MADGQALIKGKWINESGDVTIVQASPEGADSHVVLFYETERYPGWHTGDEASLEELQRNIDERTAYKTIVVGPGDNVFDVIPNDCAMTIF